MKIANDVSVSQGRRLSGAGLVGLAVESTSQEAVTHCRAACHLVAGILRLVHPVILGTPRVCFFVRKQTSWATYAAGIPKNLTT